MSVDADLATLRGFSGPDLAPGYDAALDRLEAKVATLRKERDAARKQSRESSGMYVQANEQITELLQQESFMERKMAAQREDIERLAARVEAAEAENTRLREQRDAAIHQRGVGTEWAAELAGKLHAARDERDEWEAKALDRLRQAEAAEARLGEAHRECARLQQALDGARRWFHERPWEGHPDTGSFGGQGYSSEERDLGYGTWRDPRFLPEALAGPGSEQSSLTESSSAGLPDTPADSQTEEVR